MAPVRKVHDAGLLTFLETAWSEWIKAGFRGEILPTGFPARGMRQKEPRNIDGRVGYYALAMETCITAGTWEAALASASVAQTAQTMVSEGAILGLCALPPAGASRPSRSLWRLLLPQQCSDRGARFSRRRRGPGRHPRCRFPPRQRNPGYLLRARTTCSSARFTGSPRMRFRTSSATRTRGAAAPGKVST